MSYWMALDPEPAWQVAQGRPESMDLHRAIVRKACAAAGFPEGKLGASVRRHDLRARRWPWVLVPLFFAFLVTQAQPHLVAADGSAPLLDPPLQGCYDVVSHGVGLYGDGAGNVDVFAPGPVVAVFLEWVGTEDTTPGGEGTSTLLVNGIEVVGTLATGSAGRSDTAYRAPWFAWHADVGPSGYGLVTNQGTTTLAIGGWDAPDSLTNGATIRIVYDSGPCAEPQEVQLLSGVDYYHHGHATDPFTSASMPCVPAVNPVPDEAYEPGHACPDGAAACSHRALALRPSDGGCVGTEWGVVEIDVAVPANSSWVAFQYESEKDQNGESGSWSGAGAFTLPEPDTGYLGDLVWYDADGDGVQDGSEPGIDGLQVNLYDDLGSVVGSTVTAGGGLYGFDGLGAGSYRLEIDPAEFAAGGTLANWAASPRDAATEEMDSDGDPASHDVDIVLEVGERDTSGE